MQRPSQTALQRSFTHYDGKVSSDILPKMHFDKDELCSESGVIPLLVVVYTCDRKPSYLDYTLASLRIASPLIQPIVSVDTQRAGPVKGFLNAVKIATDLLQGKTVNIMFLQDDAWVTQDAIRAGTRAWHSLLSLYRLTPHDKPPQHHLDIAGRTEVIWTPHSQTNEYAPDLIINMHDSYRSARKRYNGGVGYLISPNYVTKMLESVSRISSANPALPLPQVLGKWHPYGYSQTLHNMVHHIGEISSVPGRPEGARMPVDDIPLYDILRKEWDAEYTEST